MPARSFIAEASIVVAGSGRKAGEKLLDPVSIARLQHCVRDLTTLWDLLA